MFCEHSTHFLRVCELRLDHVRINVPLQSAHAQCLHTKRLSSCPGACLAAASLVVFSDLRWRHYHGRQGHALGLGRDGRALLAAVDAVHAYHTRCEEVPGLHE